MRKTLTTSDEAPEIARNLFNEMQAIPRAPQVDSADNDGEKELMPATLLQSNQSPSDYSPGSNEEEING